MWCRLGVTAVTCPVPERTREGGVGSGQGKVELRAGRSLGVPEAQQAAASAGAFPEEFLQRAPGPQSQEP